MHVHRYERAWILISATLLMLFGAAVVVSSLALGIQIPGVEGRAIPVAAGAMPADQPWMRELGPLRYEVNLLARLWAFEPGEIRVAKGSTVTFYLQSRDVLHGFKILGTTVSMMAIPGQVGRVTYTFDKPGEYLIVCHEYCGASHHTMSGRIIVEDR